MCLVGTDSSSNSGCEGSKASPGNLGGRGIDEIVDDPPAHNRPVYLEGPHPDERIGVGKGRSKRDVEEVIDSTPRINDPIRMLASTSEGFKHS